jgi:hypothetical protein
MDAVVAGMADHEGLAVPLCHELRPCGLRLSRPREIGESADLVHLHVGSVLAEFTSARSQATDQFGALAAGRGRDGLAVVEYRRLVPVQRYATEPGEQWFSCLLVRH